MAKKKTLRTNWKEEHRLAIVDRNNYSGRCLRLEEKLKAATEEVAGQLRENARLHREANNVGDRLDHIQTIAEMMTSAPAHSIPGDGIEGYGRDVLLGMLLEKLRTIERPIPF